MFLFPEWRMLRQLGLGLTVVLARADEGRSQSPYNAVAWGRNQYGQCDVQSPPQGVLLVEVCAVERYLHDVGEELPCAG